MTSIVIQVLKYVITFLFLGYVCGAFYVFRYSKQPEKQKRIYRLQKVLLYAIHASGFISIYLKTRDTQILGFYLMQVIWITAIFLCYHYMYKKCSILLVNHMCMLLVTGFIILTRLDFDKAFRQFVFLLIGSVIMLIIPLFLQKGSIFRNLFVLYFLLGVSLLVVVALMGATSYGAKLNIEIFGIAFQPSEFVKLLFVFFTASMLYKKSDFEHVALTSILAAVFVLALVASKDLGSALLYFVAYLAMLYVASKKALYLWLGLGGMAAASVVGYFLFSHVQTRVLVWLNPLADIDNQGFQICQSLFAIGTGGWFGFGIGEGLPNKIPIVEKDFIFSAISEEFGAIYAIALILLCVSCFILMVNVAIQMRDRFYKLVAIGLAVLYATQVILTIGGAVKFIPSTGVTLPLVSYGGSSLLSTLFLFGIMQGLYMRKTALKEDVKKERDANKEFRVINYIFLAVFLAMILHLVYFLTFESESFINNEYNKLQTLFEEKVTTGDIVTSDGYVIAETLVDEEGNEDRNYPYGRMFAHLTGYAGNVKTGLERQLNFALLRAHGFFVEDILNEFTGEKAIGDTAVTTIRYDLQETAYQVLGKRSGSVIAMDPESGKILCMVSTPSYDPNTIERDWEELQNGSALYNRATQGKYAPGSIFKILTTLAYVESNPQTYSDFTFTCTGEIEIQGKVIHCASNKSHGEVDLKTAFAKSCNCAYAYMMQEIDETVFQNLCDRLLFNKELPISFESSVSSFSISADDDIALKTDTAIGQGKTLVSPLHMVMLASAIANDGTAMYPQMIERIENVDGIDVKQVKSKAYAELFTDEQTALLTELMRETVENGTASALLKDEYEAYGKTGTAQTSNSLEQTNAWFVGYAKSGEQTIAIAVVVEDSGTGSAYAVPIAEKIFDLYFQ